LEPELYAQGELNTVAEIKRFFGGRDQPPVGNKEFQDFWQSLTEEEKQEFRTADLRN
jgi:hypothetical protein